MLMNQLPFIVASLKTVRLASEKKFSGTILEHDVHSLDCADNTHVAVHNSVHFENVDLA